MPEIHILDSDTIDKIAAGEVVERPSSVVKELVENAIDAGSSAITVEIKDGGTSLIRVTDNGCGIERSELKKAFMRHATSKIETADDLDSIHSLGFRGEALSSISAVAMVEMITKTKDSLTGVKVSVEGAVYKGMEEVGAPDGTTILVRNIFYNVPARRKFLKSAATEGSYIAELMEHLALSRADISFTFRVNGQLKFHTPGNNKIKDVIYMLYGKEMAMETIAVDEESVNYHLYGFLGKPSINRSNRNFEIYFVNGRYIRSNIISKAIEEGGRGYYMQHKFPFCVLMLEVPPELMDVNVHPSKLEVRFSNQNALFDFIMDTVRLALRSNELIPEVTIGPEIKEDKKEKLYAPEPFEVNRKFQEEKQTQLGYFLESTDSIPKPSEANEDSNPKTSKIDDDGIQKSSEFNDDIFQKPSKSNEDRLQKTSKIDDDGIQKSSEFNDDTFPKSSKPKDDTIQSSFNRKPYEYTKYQFKEANGKPVISRDENKDLFRGEIPGNHTEAEMAAKSLEALKILSGESEPLAGKTEPLAGKTRESVREADKAKGFTFLDATSLEQIETPEKKDRNAILKEQELKAHQIQAQLIGESKAEQLALFDERTVKEQNIKDIQLIGQVFDTYWIFTYDSCFYICDQHAAHEKVNFERLMKKMKEKQVTSQQVNPPVVLTLTAKELHALDTYLTYFEDFGFEIESFGGSEIALRAIPQDLYGCDEKTFFEELIDELCENEIKGSPQVVYDKIASMSCKAAVKGNNKLSAMEAKALFQELFTLENPYHCPHGRPTLIKMTQYELDKKFKRIL